MGSQLEARLFAKELRNGLQMSETYEDIVKWTTLTRAIFVPSALEKDAVLLKTFGFSDRDLNQYKPVIIEEHAKQIYDTVISLFSVEWVKNLTAPNFDSLVKPIFLNSISRQAFSCLIEGICRKSKKDFASLKCITLLEQFLTKERICFLLDSYSCYDGIESVHQKMDIDMFVSSLASFPEKMANKLGYENSDTFLPQNFIPLLGLAFKDCLQKCHGRIKNGEDISLVMLSNLVGKLCSTGYSDLFLDTLLPHLCVSVRSDFIWCRMCERVFSGVPSRNLESVVGALLHKIPWYELVARFLGDCVINHSNIKFLICTKFLLHRFYSRPKLLLSNIIGYLSSSPTKRPLLLEVCINLLKVWGDGSSMRHISAGQHKYISQALMLCVCVINDEERQSRKDELLRILMPGVQAHLESTDHEMRMIGMAVAKKIIAKVDPGGPQLEFEVDHTCVGVKELSFYEALPEDPGFSDTEKEILASINDTDDIRQENILEQEMSSMRVTDSEKQNENCSDLDSDDDLVPYDMSNDKVKTDSKPPKYVRDCMEGLICSSDNPDRTEICLQHAEALIRKNPDGLAEIAGEFAKVLLHLNDTHSFDQFVLHRFSAMVALAAMCPAQVADYLTSQFYERNYNIRQRLDILEVLANASQELSQPKKQLDAGSKPIQATITEVTPASEPSSWREVVQKRIESNTRRFAKGRTKPLPTPTENRFAQVAGQFFYPLMFKVDKSDPCLDLLGKDSLLLFRLLYTLAIVLHSSTNLPYVSQMGRALLEFTWPLRQHQEPSVRQAVLISTTTVLLAVPAFHLMSDLNCEMMEIKAWLEEIVERDPDAECQKMAAQAMFLLQEQVNKELEKNTS